MVRQLHQFVCVFALVCCGCGGVDTDYHKLDLATVKGKVMLDGNPLPNAHIMYQDQGGTFSVGKTNQAGEYEMMFNSEKSGVLTGEKLVRIRLSKSWNGFPTHPLSTETIELDEQVGEDAIGESEDGSIKESYTSNSDDLPSTYHIDSHLKVTVDSGSHTINFDLNSDGSTTGPSKQNEL